MRRAGFVLAVVLAVMASVTTAAAITGVPVGEVLSGNVEVLWSSEARAAVAADAATPAAGDAEVAAAAATSEAVSEGSEAAAAAAASAASSSAAQAGNAAEGAPPTAPPNDRAKGLVFDGLAPAAPDGPCPGGFEIEVDGETLCTHGPDAGPPGLDVRAPRTIAELTRQTRSLPSQANPIAADHSAVENGIHEHADGTQHDHGTAGAADGDGSGTAMETGIVPLIGNGTDGNRVQVIYAVAADRTDRYDEVAPLIANWAAHMDALVNESAARTGGERHIRFVTDATGNLSVARVVLAPADDDSFGNTITALRNAGYDSPSRKYLILMDANLYCGIASIYGDDRPTQDNYNNGRFAQYARVDAGCWGHTNSVELHEIVHNMGGVQQSAPHVTPGWHCTDEYDRMCYKDSAEVQMTYVCASGSEALLDCGNDDYFHTSPPAGSYLASHWNVADSSFLHAGPVGGSPPPPPPPPPTNEAPQVTVDGPATVTLPNGAQLDGLVTDDGNPGPYTVAWSKASGPGTVSFANPDAEDTTATFSTAGVYQVRLTADDGDLTGSATLTISVEDAPPPPPDNRAPAVTASAPGSVTLPDAAALSGTVTDDGLPGPYTVAWSKASGPGTVSFADPDAEDTTATFSATGEYVLELTADDGELTDSATVTITVEDGPEPPPDPVTTVTETINGSLNKKFPYRTYEVAVGDGQVDAVLTFDEAPKGNKKGAPETNSMVLTVTSLEGELLGTVDGGPPVELSLDLPAGTYLFEVSGSQISFTLEVSHVAL